MPNFTYTAGVPNPPNLPSADVGSMQVNTNSIDGWVDVDHFGFNTSGGITNTGGHHKQVYLKDQPAPAFPADNMSGVLYSDAVPALGDSWPHWRNALGSFQLTGSASANNPSPVANGWSFLPGGLIIQWGLVLPLGVTGIENFPIAFPTAVFSITTGLVNQGGGNQPQAGDTAFASVQAAPGLASFNWNWRVSTARYSAFYYMAIGN